MDIYKSYVNTPTSHFEYTVLKNNTNDLLQLVKLEAFEYMDKLEGWCTKNKASILIDLIFMFNPKTIVEIGVWGGKSLIPMAHALKVLNHGKIFGIDPWNKLESADEMEGIHYEWWFNVDHENIFSNLNNKIEQFKLQNQIILIRTSSKQAPIIPNIDILHIDGNHSEKASNLDVSKWVPLVRKGGAIIFDDMNWGTNETAVIWLNQNCIKLAEFHEDNIWGIWIKP